MQEKSPQGAPLVRENNSIIARGATDLVYKRIDPKLSDYMGKVFEDICKHYLRKQLLTENGPWSSLPLVDGEILIDLQIPVYRAVFKLAHALASHSGRGGRRPERAVGIIKFIPIS